MAWFYYLNGGNQGPVETPELQRLLERNVISLETPVWSEGMAEWAVLRDTPAAPIATAVSQVCAECGRSFPPEEMLQYENSWVCAACKPIFFQKLREGVRPEGELVFASVWKRFLALFVDAIIVYVVVYGVVLTIIVLGTTNRHPRNLPGFSMIFVFFMSYVFPALYEIIFIREFGATPGKMVLGLNVVTGRGQPLSYARSTGRYFAKFFEVFTLGIGYLMAFWTSEKRTLHDWFCDTRVITHRSS